MAEILKTFDIKKSYKETSGKLEVLKSVNLEVESGEMIAIA